MPEERARVQVADCRIRSRREPVVPTFGADELLQLASRLLEGVGASAEEAHIVADHLVNAQLAGHDSHGLIRIPQYHLHAKEGKLKLNQVVEIERQTSTTAMINGNNTWGQVVATRATELAIEKAKAHSLGAVGVRNCYHIGRVGVYPLLAASQGFICKVWCNGHGVVRVAPWGGTEPRFGTNPIAIAIPTGGDPIVVDITTSVVAEGKVRVAKNKGVQVPDGWILDRDGNPTNNPGDLYNGGSLLPMGGSVGHKGYGLAMIVDILGGALTGDGCGAMPGVPVGNGLLIEVIDPAAFCTRQEFEHNVQAFIDYVRSSKTKQGVSEILLPGEPEMRTTRQRQQEGITIDDNTWQQLQAVADEVNVKL